MIIPSNAKLTIKELEPLLINGRVVPVVGSKDMLTIICRVA